LPDETLPRRVDPPFPAWPTPAPPVERATGSGAEPPRSRPGDELLLELPTWLDADSWRPARFSQRLGARLIDSVVLTGLFVPLAATALVTQWDRASALFTVMGWGLLYLVGWPLTGLVYWQLGESGPRRTLGRAVMDIRLVALLPGPAGPEVGPMGGWRALWRRFLVSIGDLPLCLGSLSMLWSPDGLTWGDRVSHTAVIASPRPRRDAGPALLTATAVCAALSLGLVTLTLLGTTYSSNDSFGASGGSGSNGATTAASGSSIGSDGRRDSAAPSTSDQLTLAQQATSLDALLDRSEHARGVVGPAVADASRCATASYDADISAMRTAQATRQDLLARLHSADTSLLPADGVTALIDAWTASENADGSYLAWIQARQAGGCSAGSGDYDAATGYDSEATRAKTQFTSLWNPIASANGLKLRDQGTF
jgi:uncharacterized RDD family membrane protein YckC